MDPRPAVREAVSISADPLLQPVDDTSSPQPLRPPSPSPRQLSAPRLRLAPPPVATERPSSIIFDEGDTPSGSVAGPDNAPQNDIPTHTLAQLHMLPADQLMAHIQSASPVVLVRQLSLALAAQQSLLAQAEQQAEQLTLHVTQLERERNTDAHVAHVREEALSTVARTHGAGDGELERALARVSQQRSVAQRKRGQRLRLGKDLQEAMGAALSESHVAPPSTSHNSTHAGSGGSATSAAASETCSAAADDEETPPVILDATTGNPVMPRPGAELEAAALEGMAEESDSVEPEPPPMLNTPSVSSQRETRAGSSHTRSDSVASHNSVSAASSITTASRKEKETSSFTGWLFGSSKRPAPPQANTPDAPPQDAGDVHSSRHQSSASHSASQASTSLPCHSAPEDALSESESARRAKRAGALNFFGSLPWRRSNEPCSDVGKVPQPAAAAPGVNSDTSSESAQAPADQPDLGVLDNTNKTSPDASIPPISSNTTISAAGPALGSSSDGASSTHAYTRRQRKNSQPPPQEEEQVTMRPARRLGLWGPGSSETREMQRSKSSRTPRLGPNLTHPSQLYRSVSHAHISPPNGISPQLPKRTLELKPMVPKEARPPTLASDPGLSPQTGDFTPGQDPFEVYGGSGSSPATKTTGDAALTDRYGFMYAGTPADIRLLRQAKAASAPAPACLAGTRAEPMVDVEEDNPATFDDGSSLTSVRPGSPSSPGPSNVPSCARSLSGESVASASSHSPTVAGSVVIPAKARPLTKPSSVVVSTRSEGRSTAPQSDDRLEATNQPATATVKALLKSLDELYDSQQRTQQAEWDLFLAERKEKREVARRQKKGLVADSSRAGKRRGAYNAFPSNSTSPDDPGEEDEDEDVALLHHNIALVGIAAMGTTAGGRENWNAFVTLCLSGIPLSYRSQVWAECSGANDLAEPGRYKELLALSGVSYEDPTIKSPVAHTVTSASSGSSAVLAQIDLDVHRTLPTNVFFGGDGPGVPKLRRVLAAFSWYDVDIGYCQGMPLPWLPHC